MCAVEDTFLFLLFSVCRSAHKLTFLYFCSNVVLMAPVTMTGPTDLGKITPEIRFLGNVYKFFLANTDHWISPKGEVIKLRRQQSRGGVR